MMSAHKSIMSNIKFSSNYDQYRYGSMVSKCVHGDLVRKYVSMCVTDVYIYEKTRNMHVRHLLLSQ